MNNLPFNKTPRLRQKLEKVIVEGELKTMRNVDFFKSKQAALPRQ